LEIVLSATAIISLSYFLFGGNFWWHSGICLVLFLFSIFAALMRNEDQMQPHSGNRRYFMTFGHAVVRAFF